MMLLVTEQEVTDRLGVGTMPSLPVVLSGLKAAHLRMTAELDTKFERSTGNVDVFYLDQYLHGNVQPGGFFRLRLSKGFIDAPTYVEVAGSQEAIDLTTAAAGTLEAVTGNKVDAVRGYVLIPEVYKNKYVRVVYNAGFAADAVDPTKVAANAPVPEELKEAIISYTPAVMEFSSTTAASEGSPNDGYKASADHALAVLTPLYRRKNFCYTPVYTDSI